MAFDGCSGVSSLSACSGDERFSAPEETSTSNLRGVVKDEPRVRLTLLKEGCARRVVWVNGSRGAGVWGFMGDAKVRRPSKEVNGKS